MPFVVDDLQITDFTGPVANPQIAVRQGTTPVANGGTFSGFASTMVGSASPAVTFTIANNSPTAARSTNRRPLLALTTMHHYF